jgi:glutamine amidotransferase-like uncharacterized protein
MIGVRSLLIALTAFLAAACQRHASAPILLFDGEGSSPGDVTAIESILRENELAYVTVDSDDLHAMTAAELRAHRLLIVPGGNFETMGMSLGPATSASVGESVRGGLNYLGICAGAFYAGNSPYNGLNLTGVRYPFYSAERRGIRKAAVLIATPDGAALDHYWEDGPELSGWGQVVAKYPDGTPAVTQGFVGKGWVVLSGIHPEASDSWRRGMSFTSPAAVDREFALRLIQSALDAAPLPSY